MNRLVTDAVGKATIKDQGRRGTCVACAATAAHELVRSEGVDLCIEFLNWASKQRDGLSPGIEATTLEAAKAALEFEGQPREKTWPYDENRDPWSSSYTPPVSAILDAHARRLHEGCLLSPTVSAIRDSIDQGYPVVAGILLHSTWFSVGPDGFIARPTPGSPHFGGHAVLVVGYRSDELIIQNSWGHFWGKNGFAFLGNGCMEQYGIVAWSFGTW